MQENSTLLSLSLDRSPSFDTYSSGKLAEIAARVVETESNEEEGSDGEFEFSILCRKEESIPITADEIFYNGQITPVYPLFNTDLLLSNALCTINEEATTVKTKARSHRLPLKQLFSEERELTSTSCSSSEADELEGAEPGTYCVWTPKKAGESSPRLSKKSGSTGSFKKWKFRDILYRSHSDGKETFVFLTPINKKGKTEESKRRTTVSNTEERGRTEDEYAKRNRAANESEKRRSYLPYRQDLVGIFANVNGQNRNLNRY